MMSSSAPTAPQPQSESKSSTQVVSTKLPTGPDSEASQSYFTSVYQILADLEKMNRKASDYNRTATWHENFARKIDQLPVRGVARELLTYGADVSSKLRSLAASLRGVPLQLNRLENSITYDVKYNPGFVAQNWWGAVGYQQSNYDVRSNSGQIRGEQATAVAAGAEQREDIWRMLADQTTEIRLKMLDLHHLELQMPTGK